MASRKEEQFEGSFFAKPAVGSLFTVLSALAFLVLCMVLPLVGQAGVATEYARQNFYTFMAVLAVCFVLAVLAVVSKLERRRLDESPLPYSSLGLCAVCILLFIALVSGMLGV
ncbi:MAG TPA: hypothetical protein PKM67_06550 [Kiritimatiellia bacterium]|nr:hypothetical protein [Kiritimatiellia bacterium]HNS81100.1 hypothetical protein [Kiritimatiellia bacterium]HPA77574.1 hypothetical protein [Kiritimatiellia bacterium]HQQ03612.1 hypothetical protein [Kiritimatiellia bacterium]